MPKHVIEEDFQNGAGFLKLKVGDNYIYSKNLDEGMLEITTNDGSLDLDVIDNKLVITNTKPVFSTVDW